MHTFNWALVGFLATIVFIGGVLAFSGIYKPEADRQLPQLPTLTAEERATMNLQQAMFGAGCFWGVEEIFRKVPGVVDVAVGYAGGTTEGPTYQTVCSGRTGHAEVVYVEYDADRVTYEQLLDIFFNNHNPTTLNRQGPDVGSQYRSVVLYYDEVQRVKAVSAKEQLEQSKKFLKPIVTTLEPADKFYRAEEYHQRYLEKNGLGNCHI